MIDISILMPVYNSEKFVVSAIKSIIDQNFTNWELIIVDDGSTDNSGRICDEVATTDTRIKVIHKKNTGVSDTRNIALKAAKGKYVGFVDSDDCIDSRMYKSIIEKIEKYNSDLGVCGITENKYDGDKIVNAIDYEYFPKDFVEIKEMKNLIMNYSNSNLLNSLCNKVYLRKVIDENKLKFKESLNNGEDFAFNLEYMSKIKSLVFCKESFYYYSKRNNESITHKYVEDMYSKGLEIHDIFEAFLIEMDYFDTENEYVLLGNHLMGVFAAFLNLFHKDCKLNLKKKREYIRNIIGRPYVKKCVKARSKGFSTIAYVAKLIKLNNISIILLVFKGISIIQNLKYRE